MYEKFIRGPNTLWVIHILKALRTPVDIKMQFYSCLIMHVHYVVDQCNSNGSI